jgi:L-lactate utilization protein LutB
LGKYDNTRKEELKTQLNEIRDKQIEIKKGKKSVYEQLDALNSSIKKKVMNAVGKVYMIFVPDKFNLLLL